MDKKQSKFPCSMTGVALLPVKKYANEHHSVNNFQK